ALFRLFYRRISCGKRREYRVVLGLNLKKIIMIKSFLTLVSLGVVVLINSQQWTGNLDIASPIYRMGNVGIGIATPLSTFHVNGGLRITGKSPNYGGPTLIFGQSGRSSAEFGNYNIEYLPNKGLNFSIPWPNAGYGNYDLFLSTTNKVGIGTDNFSCGDCAEYRLFVKEGIRTEKIKVDVASVNDWADYVFDKEYKLMPLNELEKFIDKNKRLPEILSAQEIVEQGGVELKEMNIKLLQKIEELTLYLIQQDKKIKELQQIIKNEK
ncbi:MAG: hypothetical protein Q4G16_11345, partial [Cruoricaptor ignavus]|nr:hypothetical protein [Cruoricaptor ignavus]